MQRRWMGILVLVGMALSAGCGCSAGGGGGQKDAVADQGPGEFPPGDVHVTPDGGPDVVPDGIPDAAPDGVADVTPEGQVPDVPTPDAEPDATGTPLPYSFATYNTGLAINFVPLAPERFLPVVDAVSKLEAEVVCLQEVWEVDHVIALRDKVKAAFPYSLYVDTTEAEGCGAPACTAEELKPLQDRKSVV